MKVLLIAIAISCAFAQTVSAQTDDPRVEVGATLVTLGFTFERNGDTTFLTVPSFAFNGDPGLYASLFVNRYLAIEPQLGLLWASSSGGSSHVLNIVGQADVFVNGAAVSSPYLFGGVGVLDASGSGPTPKTFHGGFGYRALAGDRLAFRFESRFTHGTDELGNRLTLSVAIGGVFR